MLPRAKTRIALGQALELPRSSSSSEPPKIWRSTRLPSSAPEGSGTAIGEAAVKAARRESVKYFILKFMGLVVSGVVSFKEYYLVKSMKRRIWVNMEVSVVVVEIRRCSPYRGEVYSTYTLCIAFPNMHTIPDRRHSPSRPKLCCSRTCGCQGMASSSHSISYRLTSLFSSSHPAISQPNGVIVGVACRLGPCIPVSVTAGLVVSGLEGL